MSNAMCGLPHDSLMLRVKPESSALLHGNDLFLNHFGGGVRQVWYLAALSRVVG